MSDTEFWDAIESIPQAIAEYDAKSKGLMPYKVTWTFKDKHFENSKVFYARTATEAERMFADWLPVSISKVKEYKIRKA